MPVCVAIILPHVCSMKIFCERGAADRIFGWISLTRILHLPRSWIRANKQNEIRYISAEKKVKMQVQTVGV